MEMEVQQLIQAHKTLSEQVKAMQQCLIDMGILRAEQVRAACHRQKFAAWKQATDYVPTVHSEDALGVRNVVSTVLRHSQPETQSALSATQ